MDEKLAIRTAVQYRRAIFEVQRFETAYPDSEECRRRHLLLAAMHLLEQKPLGSDLKPGKPALFSVLKR
jgi:hypothetical protein